MVLKEPTTRIKPERAIRYLLMAYFFFVPFVRLFFFPVVSAKVQPTELVFLCLFPLAVYHYGRKLLPASRNLLFVAGFYLSANLVSAINAGTLNAILEALGRGYLLALALLIAQYVKAGEDGNRRAEELVIAWSAGALLMAVISAIGYIAALNGVLNRTVLVYENYPYFGTMLRASGLTGGANSVVYVCLLPLLYYYRKIRRGGKGWGLLLLLFGICLATISKDLVLIFLGCFLVDPWVIRKAKQLRPLAVAGTALVLWFGTHFIVQRPVEVTGSYLEGTSYTSEKILWQGNDLQLLETSYLALKNAGVSVGSKHPLVGVGPGQFNGYLPEEKALGNYPAHLPEYDPHSTWIGAFSETGILGLASTIILFVVLYRLAVGRMETGLWYANDYVLPLGVSLLIFLIASVSLDIMNFRFVWAPIGILLGLAATKTTACAA